ncbi:hypothetical protein NONO_c63720 [Nocardia nova SH22a]|uniref:ESX-1 secretion-associated protein n=1 Tax=Nocardia nova SH22a TaxID=1415166 RepID=W5TPG3_9NOCA|nr:hypothetical protein [Nocardia nova]AHH21142.1 hypothetical protein NONO_c63720 [Nocardia nova SH22a]
MQTHEAGDLRTDVGVLAQAVEDGRLWIDGVLVGDGTHERCARRYETLAEQIEQQIRALAPATALPGFGGFDSGAALRGGFEGKAADAVERLQEYAAAARQLAQTLRAAAAAYVQHDGDSAAALARTVPPAVTVSPSQPVGVGHA